ncbi:MAG: SUMF1/EgtB/PvdO family nonheme iron enzyme [Bacteroidales bacterium]|jgi:formylglycine-generating enzyme required for sulfatase activity|nr:SUMF1/EgtB/PvdO family nonheme iron enzyme [Bacteroidales bacterium]
MKRLIPVSLLLFIIILYGCGSSTGGELTGVDSRGKYFEPDPYGMTFIPLGSFTIGPSDQDIAWSQNNMSKTVTIDAFWMDETEITNNEYRQFVFWVKDSIMRRTLAKAGVDGFLAEGDQYDMLDEDKRPLNWKTKIDVHKNEDQRDALEEMYLPENERFFGHKEIDTRKLIYEYYWVDIKQAANPHNRYDFKKKQYNGFAFNALGERIEVKDRSAFVMHDNISVYPDTLCWISDFSYSYNEPMTSMYFWHVAYDSYPVVGVTWKQATAFCIWRTELLNNTLAAARDPLVHHYRLPTEYEWEYAARGGLQNSKYPWGGPYTRNNQGCFLANFKPLRGNYADDGGVRTVRVGTYEPNEWGLYDMAGNVAEWTRSAYDESAYRFTHDLNPDYRYEARDDEPAVMKRKVIRGGSWKDIEYFLQVSTRAYEYQDTATTYIGFRCLRDYLGNSVK